MCVCVCWGSVGVANCGGIVWDVVGCVYVCVMGCCWKSVGGCVWWGPSAGDYNVGSRRGDHTEGDGVYLSWEHAHVTCSRDRSVIMWGAGVCGGDGVGGTWEKNGVMV